YEIYLNLISENEKKKVVTSFKKKSNVKTRKYAEYLVTKKTVHADIDLMKPKVPGNAFTIFIKSLDQGELKLKDFMYDAAIKWNMLPEEEKDVFRTLAKKYEKQYCHEISQWEKKNEKNWPTRSGRESSIFYEAESLCFSKYLPRGRKKINSNTN
ncbi:hypothetical protein OTU49_013368, partial [Cherax quadricarinatus]